MQGCNKEGYSPPEINSSKGWQGKQQELLHTCSSKKKTRENVGLLLNKVMEDTEREELLNAFFALVLTAKASPQNSRS